MAFRKLFDTELWEVLLYLRQKKLWRNLGAIIDKKLLFDSHINSLCKKTCQKLSRISWISIFIDLKTMQILFQSMIKSKFIYCPLIWMFSSRKSNNIINKIHERYDKNSSFEDLLKPNHQIIVHQRNIQVLMTEVFKNDGGP